jgi:hypothetical protein
VSVLRESGEATLGCAQFNDAVLAHLITSEDVKLVALVARWPIYAEATRPAGEGRRAIPFLRLTDDQPLDRERSRKVLAESLARTVGALREASKKVILVGPVPEVAIDVPACWAHASMSFKLRSDCEAEASTIEVRNAFTSELLAQQSPRACVRFPAKALCAGGRCLTRLGGKPLYVDSNHLSATGAALVARDMGLAECL